MKVREQQILFFVFIFFQIGIGESFSQKIAIENAKQNTVYPYLDNPMIILVEGIPCKDIYISTDNGKMKSEGNCEYNFLPQKIGRASIFIHKIEKGDTIQIEEKKYRVKRWPKPEARIGRKNSGKLALGKFKAQKGIIVPIENFDIDANCKVISFQLQIIRGRDLIGEVINLGGRFEKKTKSLILKVEKGDRIIINEIQVLMPGSKEKIELDEIDIEIN